MPTIEVFCTVDLQPSVDPQLSAARQLGEATRELLRLCTALVHRNQGSCANPASIPFTARFHDPERALAFGTQMQQLIRLHASAARTTFSVAIALSQGLAIDSSPHRSSPTTPLSSCAPVSIDAKLWTTCGELWGSELLENRCQSMESGQLFRFDWEEYGRSSIDASIAGQVYEHFKRSGVVLSNFTVRDLNLPGMVIWPVVPRQLATAIHRGQIELIRLLSMLGWRVAVLVADCGDGDAYTSTYIDKFQACLSAAALRRGIAFERVVRMTELYDPGYVNYRELQLLFRSVSSRMTVAELMAINNKNYSEPDIIELRGKTTLTYIRPPLTIAAVLHLAAREQGKCAVVSGYDEAAQWTQAFNETGATSKIGALMIPVIKMNKEHQLLQQRRWPIWDSEAELLQHISDSESNTAWWLFRLHAFMPSFPDNEIEIGGTSYKPEEWSDEQIKPSGLDATAFVNRIWPLLDPAASE